MKPIEPSSSAFPLPIKYQYSSPTQGYHPEHSTINPSSFLMISTPGRLIMIIFSTRILLRQKKKTTLFSCFYLIPSSRNDHRPHIYYAISNFSCFLGLNWLFQFPISMLIAVILGFMCLVLFEMCNMHEQPYKLYL